MKKYIEFKNEKSGLRLKADVSLQGNICIKGSFIFNDIEIKLFQEWLTMMIENTNDKGTHD